MQQTFSAFPRGVSALGLLVLRLASGVSVIASAFVCLIASCHLSMCADVFESTAILSGILLLIGYLTRPAALAALFVRVMPLFLFAQLFPAGCRVALDNLFLLIAVMLALFCLGPGAVSVEAKLYGREEIVIPR